MTQSMRALITLVIKHAARLNTDSKMPQFASLLPRLRSVHASYT